MKINGTADYLRNQYALSTKPTAAASSETEHQSEPIISGTSFSGKGLMLSRLFGSEQAEPKVQTQLDKNAMAMPAVNFLTTADRDMLADLYQHAAQQQVDLQYVDDLAFDLGRYRMLHQVAGNLNNGTMFDASGRQQSFHFTADDSASAQRILDSSAMAGSVFDAGFLRFELDPGFSFNHRGNFQFLEQVLATFGADPEGRSFDPQFRTYQSQGKHNFVVEVSEEVHAAKASPDFINVDGVFQITEQGRNNGFQMIRGEPVQIKMPANTAVNELINQLLDTGQNHKNKDSH